MLCLLISFIKLIDLYKPFLFCNIKALSNQKYRDLQEEFSDVGLMTGDITINPSATCLVMTTEILRSMLYRGSEIMREVAWVIYDEVHYMRDKERGVVWEESIILLPHKVRFVFLSATIPNARQFVNWIAKIHRQKCHVVYTNYRPVPLQHYIFPVGGDGLHLVVDEKGKFREGNFQKAMATLKGGDMDSAMGEALSTSGNGKAKKRKRGGGGKGQSTDLFNIIKLVMERNLNPVIVFSFSKKDCEKYALELKSEDYSDEVEKDLISQVYTNAIESLSEDDQKLPQVEALLPLLKRGIGIHHGGLLPILKEIVEILFSEGLIKCLFATETFAIGINMPAKTVSFSRQKNFFYLLFLNFNQSIINRLYLLIQENGMDKRYVGLPLVNISKCLDELVDVERMIVELLFKWSMKRWNLRHVKEFYMVTLIL